MPGSRKIRMKWGYNSKGEYVGPLKKIHAKPKGGTVMFQRLRNGTLDADLKTGEVFGIRGKMTPTADKDGYLRVWLSLPSRRKKADRDGRKRWRQVALVHRIVMMKKKAVEVDPVNWREHVKELPAGIDVNHEDRDRANNRASNLSLQTERHNRHGEDMTPEEEQAIEDYYDEGY